MIIDLHTHILPGVDDGAQSMETALSMLEMAMDSGVGKIVLTPHCNVPEGPFNYYSEELAQKFRMFRDTVRDAELNIEILPGMEVFANSDVPKLLREKKLLTLNCSRYLLLEFGFNESVPFTFSLIDELCKMGCIPLIAHPERYPYVQTDPNIVFEWLRMGACTQINKGSIFGSFGVKAGKTAMQLLQNDMVTVVGSDAHDIKYRSSNMTDAFEYIESVFSSEYANVIFFENPDRIISDKSVLQNAPMPV